MNTMKYLWLLVIGVIASAAAAPKFRICAQFPENDSSQDDDDYSEYVSNSPEVIASTRSSRSVQPSSESLQSGSFVECSQDYDFCFGLWTSHANGTKVVKQGCWKESGDRNVTCVQKECLTIGHKRTSVNGDVNMYYYCCCSGDMCNQNMTVSYPLELTHSVISRDVERPNGEGTTQVLGMNWPNRLIMLAFCFAIAAIISGFMFVRCNKPGDMPGPEAAPLAPSGPGYSSNLHNVDNLKLCSMIGQGKYGTVWKGLINEQAVAVKIFPSQHKQCFINEKNIYSLPLMECPSLLSYFGCDERRNMDDRIEYFLVLSLAPLGCLQDWLIANTANFGTFCKMAKSITRGLSHLHTELQRGDDLKPCIAHRDLNTRNILVNADLTCAIADFGFALKVFGSKYEYRGEAAFAEIKSINEVGTLRYMAPEILEGAVNLRDCESALKQTDVYSLGLVLWELCTRCSDFYAAGQAIPAYKSPYEAEVGKHPTFEQMQVLVARHKARPLFPAGWGGAAAGKLVRDTCEDCWDHDAEARLTSLCAEERMHELCNLRPRSHISLGGHGPSPPLSANNFVGQSPTRRLRSFSSNSCNLETEQTIVTPPNQIIPRVRSCGNDATSPIVGLHSASATEKNHLIYSQQIQPYQGRNPCQERNLAPVTVKPTQVLVEKSKKHSFQDKSQDNSFSCLEDDVSVEDLISANSKKLAQDTIHLGQGFPKQNNTDKKLRGWHGVRALIQKKLFRKDFYQSFDEKSNLVDNRSCSKPSPEITSPTKNTTVNLVENKHHNCQHSILTTIDSSTTRRPNNLDLVPITVRVNGLSPENKSNLIKSISEEYQCSLKFSPEARCTQSAVDDSHTKSIASTAATVLRNIPKETILTPSEEKQIVRQRSLELFREVFNARSNSTDHRLRNPSQRVKTPGDVPPSVRKVRASKTLSLYDDRMMDSSTLNIL